MIDVGITVFSWIFKIAVGILALMVGYGFLLGLLERPDGGLTGSDGNQQEVSTPDDPDLGGLDKETLAVNTDDEPNETIQVTDKNQQDTLGDSDTPDTIVFESNKKTTVYNSTQSGGNTTVCSNCGVDLSKYADPSFCPECGTNL